MNEWDRMIRGLRTWWHQLSWVLLGIVVVRFLLGYRWPF